MCESGAGYDTTSLQDVGMCTLQPDRLSSVVLCVHVRVPICSHVYACTVCSVQCLLVVHQAEEVQGGNETPESSH